MKICWQFLSALQYIQKNSNIIGHALWEISHISFVAFWKAGLKLAFSLVKKVISLYWYFYFPLKSWNHTFVSLHHWQCNLSSCCHSSMGSSTRQNTHRLLCTQSWDILFLAQKMLTTECWNLLWKSLRVQKDKFLILSMVYTDMHPW